MRSAIQGILLVNEIAAIANIQHFAQFWRQAHRVRHFVLIIGCARRQVNEGRLEADCLQVSVGTASEIQRLDIRDMFSVPLSDALRGEVTAGMITGR